MNQQLDIKKGKKKEQSTINKLRRSELLKLISELNDSLEEKTTLLLKERKNNRSFERVLISKNFREYFREFSKTILIKETSSIRILFSKKDFFLQPFSIGYGSLSGEYSYLDDQISDQLGGMSHLIIQDTSKIHNIKFYQGKSFPRSLIAFPIIHNDLKVGCIWIGDEKYQAFSKKEVEELNYIVNEYQKTLAVLFKTISTSQEIITLRRVFDSIEEPVLIVNRQKIITHANPSAIKEFNLIRDENESFFSEESYFNDLFNSPEGLEKIEINNKKEFKVGKLEVNSLDTEGVTCYRFIDKTGERALNKYLSTIISTITHYLRTPMIEIKGLAALISSMGNLSEKQKEFLNTMSNNIDEIDKNVKELMSIDRLNKDGFVEINEVVVDDCIDDAIFTLAPLAEQKQITIRFDYDEQRKKIFSDVALLNHALLNILDYAIKESHMGGIVEIKSYNELNAFFISIKDSGKGISKPDIKKMMDDKSLDQYTDEIEITKNIMKILNGDVLIESNLGSGKTITLKFPHVVSLFE
jgi:signal transduction histidine kinase